MEALIESEKFHSLLYLELLFLSVEDQLDKKTRKRTTGTRTLCEERLDEKRIPFQNNYY